MTVSALAGEPTLQRITVAGAEVQLDVDCTALFSFIGAEPNSDWLDGVAVDEHGFVLTDRSLDQAASATRGPRWGAAAAVRDEPARVVRRRRPASGSTKRVAAAVGEGSAAIRSVHEHLALTAGA